MAVDALGQRHGNAFSMLRFDAKFTGKFGAMMSWGSSCSDCRLEFQTDPGPGIEFFGVGSEPWLRWCLFGRFDRQRTGFGIPFAFLVLGRWHLSFWHGGGPGVSTVLAR